MSETDAFPEAVDRLALIAADVIAAIHERRDIKALYGLQNQLAAHAAALGLPHRRWEPPALLPQNLQPSDFELPGGDDVKI